MPTPRYKIGLMTDTEIAVVNPVTGEVLDALETQPPETLADTLYAVRQHTSDLRKVEQALADELRRRIGTRDRTVFQWGEYEVTAKPEYRREWDPEELEGTLRELLDQGTVQAGELTEIIRHETVVSGKEALHLLGHLSGDSLKAVERCFSWKQKGPARVQVTPTVPLLPEEIA